ncbi:MAG: hypothetical protein ACYTG2_10540 [Planctomycetota bacterium]|jgi:hypothetical protein
MGRVTESGWGFMVVAVLCFAAAITSEARGVFVGVGAFWMILAIVVRARNAGKHSSREDDTET